MVADIVAKIPDSQIILDIIVGIWWNCKTINPIQINEVVVP